MIQRWGERLARLARRWMPDPFIFAVLLTFLTLLLALLFTDAGFVKLVQDWQDGLFSNLTFGMQMCLILVTGHALATSPAVRRLIHALARIPRHAATAPALVAFFASAAALVHWGLGVIVGALLAREVALSGRRRGLPIHYPLLGAAAYMGLLVWHGGLSGSAPLQAATPGKEVVPGMGVVPVSETLGSAMNISVALFLPVVITLFCYMLTPTDPALIRPVDEYEPAREPVPAAEDEKTPAARLENNPLITVIIAGLGLYFVARHFLVHGFALDLNIVNAAFLFLGLLAQWRPIRYVRAVAEGTRSVSGIILQFPFYFGIQGIMAGSGLVQVLADLFVRISSQSTLPLFTFLSAGLINLFIPSGGGQWIVQGPVMVQAAQSLGASVPKVIMALAYGDEWTNMIQPFWAIPVLGITGLKAGEIIGYSAMLLVFSGLVFTAALLLF